MNFIRKIVRTGVSSRDAVGNFKKALNKLVNAHNERENDEEVPPNWEEYQNKVADALCQIRFMLIGDTETPAVEKHKDKISALLLGKNQEEGEETLLMQMLKNGKLYAPDAQKEMTTVFNWILRHKTEEFRATFKDKFNVVVDQLLEDYGDKTRPRLQVQISTVLREMMKDSELHRFLLYDCPRLMDLLFDKVKATDFDISSDGLSTLKQLLTKNKKTVSKYLDQNYQKFFDQYNDLIKSDNYVTKRQSLKLLGDVLLDKQNKATMMRYIGEKPNLKLLMMMLRDDSKAITFEAFHVFKVFVANPHKEPEIYKTLFNNKDKLVSFLETFQQSERETDNQFIHEKGLLIGKLNQMKQTPEEYLVTYNNKQAKKGGKKKKPSAKPPTTS